MDHLNPYAKVRREAEKKQNEQRKKEREEFKKA